MVFKIAAPSTVAGTYGLLKSTFGPQAAITISDKPLNLAIPIQACGIISNDLSASIAFVDRGDCNFIDKVKNAQEAGAVAVIICNDDREIVNPMLPNGAVDIAKVQSFMMEKDDCIKIKLALSNGLEKATIIKRQCEPVSPANSIWGADFNGGLNGWTITTEEGKGWIWNAKGDCSANIMPVCSMNTPTVCNGAISINGNALDVSGDCQATCISSIISPNIDLSSVKITALNLQFNQAIRDFRSRYFVISSYDNGATWLDTIEINKDIFANEPFVANQLVKVGLCGTKSDIKSIRLQFLCQSNYYFWGVDDVYLINEAYADPQVNNNFWATPPSLKTPVTQATDFPLLTDIKNNGTIVSPNTKVTCTVTKVDNNGNLIGSPFYTQDYIYNNVQPCEQIENKPFSNHFNEPDKVGRYRLNYMISSDNNKFTGNDNRASDFFMTYRTHSNALTEAEFGSPYMEKFISGVRASFIGLNTKFWSVGTSYYFPKGASRKATEFKFGVDTLASLGVFSAAIKCSVYKILNNDVDPAYIIGSERKLVGNGFDVDGAEEMYIENTTKGRRRSKFILKNLEGNDLVLEDNSSYLFMLDVRSFSGSEYFPFLSYNPNSTNQTLRWGFTEATNLGFAKESINRHFGTCVSIDAQEVDNVNERKLATNFFKVLCTEVISENIDTSVGIKNESNNNFSVFPNPASNELLLDLGDKIVSRLDVEFLNLTGQSILTEKFENIKTKALKINTTPLPRGLYIVTIKTENGQSSLKVMIEK